MNLPNYLKNKNGLTLVELLVALSLVSVVLVVSTMIALMGLNTFKMDVNQSDVQYEVRRTSAKITDKLRNAIEISAINTLDEEIDLDIELNNVESYECEYTVSDDILTLSLKAEKEGTEFELKTDILLNNKPIGISDATSVMSIYYELPSYTEFESDL